MSRSEILLESLTRFFDEEENYKILSDVLSHRMGISLRSIEWFVTKHSKSEEVRIMGFPVHVEYKSSLNGYSKKLFDPFCRTERIQFKEFTTTVGQLNFIKWCIVNGIIRHMIMTQPLPEKSEVSTHNNICTC
jgi:glutaredoxin 2